MNRFRIYTSASCPYCVAAKQFIARKGWEYEEFRIDLDPRRREEMLSRSAGRRSVPQIFINEIHIGGFDDLIAADREGRLQELAAAVS
ncbi:glutaredoxin 3 [Dokdonella sp.]|uniref:glutaredoxin 3 n=1 Tax=Dokdonella sp. TaxID=2291710 RepID=UPI0031C830AF|nr:glutaredoxin 3 [Dokdonella sp.]